MAPLLVSALVGVGVKLATDFLVSGAKQWFGGTKTAGATGATGTSFAATLDKLRGAPPATAPAAMTASAATSAVDVALADRSRVMTTEASAGVPKGAHAVAAYQRLNQIEAP